jgi:hypothetical protein
MRRIAHINAEGIEYRREDIHDKVLVQVLVNCEPFASTNFCSIYFLLKKSPIK